MLLCPLLGWRHLEGTAQRGYHVFAPLRRALVDVSCPAAVVRVVLDNRNTHVRGALYETFDPEVRVPHRWQCTLRRLCDQ